MARADKNEDGHISEDEFIRFSVERMKELRKIFDQLDKDKSGKFLSCK